jgi:hypothetical protein
VQTAEKTSPQVKPREALQEAGPVPSAEVLQVHPQVNFRATMEFDPRTAGRNAPDFAARFAPQVASRIAVRTTPGTVPGTVPTAVPGRSILARSTATKAALRCYLSGFGLTEWC